MPKSMTSNWYSRTLMQSTIFLSWDCIFVHGNAGECIVSNHFKAWTRDSQWIGFSLLISAHENLSMSGSTVLKFILIYSDSVQYWFISIGCNEYEYNIVIKLITFEICLIHAVLVVFAFTNTAFYWVL